ncbi:MAG: serine/threonine-protein kinase [Candidatus Eremiobacteraeota bacterium]|nr:serine/threonine-protein kinase [Candidatus Eremiobacteraeota bacterium]
MGELKEGKVLKGRYEIARIIEETPDHVLYLAHDKLSHGAALSVREIKAKTKSGKSSRVELAQKEAQILSSLSHPGIPRFVDFFTGVDCHYFITEFIEGDPLEVLLKSRGTPFEFKDVAPWALQLCDIVTYLHTKEKPIIVRGIQPSSIVLTFKNDIKLTNFGMARQFDEIKTIDTVFVWNPGYTSPEQYGKQKSDVRSDIYSFGATFYNLLTNQDVGSMNFNFPSPAAFNSTIPSGAESIVMKCLAINPDERYQMISEVKEDILKLDTSSRSEPSSRNTEAPRKAGIIDKLFGFMKKR